MRAVSVVLVTFAAAALLWNARQSPLPGDALSRHFAAHPELRECAIEGTVRLTYLDQSEPDRSRFLLDVDRLVVAGDARSIEGGVIVWWGKPGEPVYAGDRVRVRGSLTIRLGHVNPHTPCYEDHLRARGVHSALWAGGPDAVERIASGAWWSPAHWASRLRVKQGQYLAQAVPASVLPFVRTIWLGERSTIGEDEYQTYIDSGTAHILAISGLHMGLVFASLTFVLRIFMKHQRWRALVIMAAVFFYALMAGARPSCLRAAIMVSIYLLADLFEREPDSPTALSIATVVFLMWNPALLFDGSVLLSFLSIASILLFAEPVTELLRRAPALAPFQRRVQDTAAWRILEHSPLRRVLPGGLGTSLAVQILPFPAAIHMFHVFPLVAAVTNLLVIPLATIVLWLCFLTSVAAMVSVRVAMLFGYGIEPVVTLISQIVGLVGSSPMTHVRLTSPTALAAIAFYGAIVACAAALKLRRFRRLAGLCAAGLAALCVVLWNPLRPQAPTVVFLDVGHGDATFIRAPGGATMLVDGGDKIERQDRGKRVVYDLGKRVVAPFLWSNHVRRLNYVVLSHADRDHIGGLFCIVSHFRVGQVLLSGIPSGKQLEEDLVALCAARGVPVRRLHAGERFALGRVPVEVLHPPAHWPQHDNVNDQSLVLRVDLGTTSILLTGDIQARAESAVSATACAAGILKIPHHGSKTSSTEPFIAAVQANDGIVSTGGRKGREAVAEDVLARYRGYGVRLWRTDYLGGIGLTFKDGRPRLEGARQQRKYPYTGS